MHETLLTSLLASDLSDVIACLQLRGSDICIFLYYNYC